MKKISLLIILGVLLVGITSCTAAPTAANPTGGANSTSETQPGLSTLNLLAVGIFKLDGTANDITADQAKELVTLWKAYNQVSNSDTSAPEEKTALVNQIQSTLTTEQFAVIQGLNLTAEDVRTMMREKGISAEADKPATSSSSSSTSNRSGGGPGGMPGGGFGGGIPGGGPMDGGGMPGGTAATPGANQPPNGRAGGGFVSENMTQAIIKALISLLETKAA